MTCLGLSILPLCVRIVAVNESASIPIKGFFLLFGTELCLLPSEYEIADSVILAADINTNINCLDSFPTSFNGIYQQASYP